MANEITYDEAKRFIEEKYYYIPWSSNQKYNGSYVAQMMYPMKREMPQPRNLRTFLKSIFHLTPKPMPTRKDVCVLVRGVYEGMGNRKGGEAVYVLWKNQEGLHEKMLDMVGNETSCDENLHLYFRVKNFKLLEFIDDPEMFCVSSHISTKDIRGCEIMNKSGWNAQYQINKNDLNLETKSEGERK